MQLIKKQFINSSKLSVREYLVSLLREAQKSGLVLPESAARIQKEGMDIVADLAARTKHPFVSLPSRSERFTMKARKS